ncbi:MAG: rod shape-determining protein RodA [Rhodospirillales bacterium]|nr:rod shape-determining protein RodA [Alphaproteobacteria bacterium]MBL6948933.1 rod shape-determining protein RodA [Rhodospirillales bacterium]
MNDPVLGGPELTLRQKLWQIHWFFVLLLAIVASVGFAMLYSAAGGSIDPWAKRHAVRFGFGIVLMISIAVIDTRIWLRYAYAVYFAILLMLVSVDVGGAMGMGARRWINLGVINLQPSELMKVAMVLALARYFHGGSLEDIRRPIFLIPPILIVVVPAAFVLRQPDLGTSLILLMTAAGIFFLAGVRLWKFALVGVLSLAAMPVAWQFLHEYQKKRVLTFLNPESDPLGAGYHIIQSKIAFGSGGLSGRGFMQGTQGHLNFLPEMQTDFIFTMLSEELGLIGGLILLCLYILMLIYGISISVRSRSHFGCLLGMGVTSTFFLYVFINIAMVMGLIPVVGVPLPLISYGGTAMLTLLIGFGLLMGVWVHRDVTIGRRGAADD